MCMMSRFKTMIAGAAAVLLATQFGMAASILQFQPMGHLNEVREDAGSAQVTIVRSGDVSYPVSVRMKTVGKSASAGADFGMIDSVISFGAFQTSAVVTIPIVADQLFEGNEKIRVKLSEPSSGARLARTQIAESLFINDAQDDPLNDDFAAAISLPGANGTLAGTNRGASREPGEPYHVKPRNRSVWYSYQAPGDGFAKFWCGNRRFKALLAAYAGSSLGGLARKNPFDDSDDSDDSDDWGSYLTIKVQAGQVYRLAVDDSDDSDDSDDRDDSDDSDDSDDGHGTGGRNYILRWKTILPGQLQFAKPVFTVDETAGSARIKVTRSGGAGKEVRVNFATRDVTAVDPDDYTGASGELVFPKGIKERTFDIEVNNDTLFERAPRTVKLVLGGPTGGARLGLARATLQIRSDDPFTPGKGKYTAGISPAVFSHAETGRLAVRTGALGGLTGRLRLGGKSYALSGVFDAQNHLRITKNRDGRPPLIIDLQLSDDGADISGSVDDGVVTNFSGKRNGYDADTNPCPLAGRFTVLLPADAAGASGGFPRGDGWAKMKISRSGTATLVGALADGTPFSAGLALSSTGDAPIYVPLYRGKGSLSGSLVFATIAGVSDATGTLHLFKPASALRAGFEGGLLAVASRYTKPDGTRILAGLDASAGAASLTFGAGGLPADATQAVKVNLHHNVSLPPSPTIRLTMTIVEKNGLFSGQFNVPGTARRPEYRGVFLQVQNRAGGFFLDRGVSGFVRLAPAP
jgi:hypothetical protein